MKGFSLLAATTLTVIGIGVGVESTQSSGPPDVVLAAIEKTMAASSLTMTLAPSSPPKGYRAAPSATFNAPDRYEVRNGILEENGTTFPTIFIGHTEYVEDPTHPSTSGNAPKYLDLPFVTPGLSGLNGEQLRAFPEMQILRSGEDFEKGATGYSFRLFMTETIRLKHPGLTPVRPVVVRFMGGSVVLDDGYIRQLTIDEVTDGRANGTSVTYSDFNRAPTILRPTAARSCSSFALRTPEGELCAALAPQQH